MFATTRRRPSHVLALTMLTIVGAVVGARFLGPTVTAAADFACPVPALSGYGQGWGAPRRGHIHHGIDILAPAGTPIVAPADGVVTNRWDGTGGGNWATVTAPDGTQFWNMHLSSFSLPSGGRVTAGQEIGRVGSTGDATGPHDHFEYHPGGRSAVPPEALVRSACSHPTASGPSPNRSYLTNPDPVFTPPPSGQPIEIFDTDPAPVRLARDVAPKHYVVQSLVPGVNHISGVSVVAASKTPGRAVPMRALVYADLAQTQLLGEAHRVIADNRFTEFVFEQPVPVDPKGVYLQLYNDSSDTSVGVWFAKWAYDHGNSWMDGENYLDPAIVDLDIKAVVMGFNG